MFFQPAGFNVALALPMFFTWIVLTIMGLYLIYSGKKSLKALLLIYVLSIFIGGILIGGIPNAVMPIQQIFMAMGLLIPITVAIPMIIILGILLFSTLIFGRIFCGFACPVGALQELASRVRFTSKVKGENKTKLNPPTSQKVPTIIRWISFILFAILTIGVSVPILQILNPFIGFNIIGLSLVFLGLIPLFSLLIIFFLSFFVYRPWCRYICPFGALASLTSRFSRYKLTRTDACTQCGLCEKVCPTNEAKEQSNKAECYYCQRCMEICPQNAIKLIKV